MVTRRGCGILGVEVQTHSAVLRHGLSFALSCGHSTGEQRVITQGTGEFRADTILLFL